FARAVGTGDDDDFVRPGFPASHCAARISLALRRCAAARGSSHPATAAVTATALMPVARTSSIFCSEIPAMATAGREIVCATWRAYSGPARKSRGLVGLLKSGP